MLRSVSGQLQQTQVHTVQNTNLRCSPLGRVLRRSWPRRYVTSVVWGRFLDGRRAVSNQIPGGTKWAPMEVVWPVGSVFSASWMHLHLRCHEVKPCLITIPSPKTHFNAGVKGVSEAFMVLYSGCGLTHLSCRFRWKHLNPETFKHKVFHFQQPTDVFLRLTDRKWRFKGDC